MIGERRKIARYCSGDISEVENYALAIADTTQKWVCHHRKELTEDGDFAYSAEDLIKNGEYYKRPSEELIFLTEFEHKSLHSKGSNNPMYGKEHSDDSKENISKGKKGNPYKHHDITVSAVDDRKAYKREWDIKNKEKNKAKRRERDRKRKLSTPNK